MNYNINIREETFGGTVCNLESGKREYITRTELRKILDEQIFPEDSIVKDIKNYKIKYTPLNNNRNKFNHFSFADVAYIELTRACNLRCKHCLNNSGKVMKNQLDTNEFLNLIENLSKAGIQEIRFTGGEPLVFKDIYNLIEIATNNGIYTSIGTNGTLITPEIAKKLKKVGLKKAVVSIDGTEQMHDKIRGQGNYQRTINGIKNLENVGIKVRVNAVIMKSNIDNVIELAKELHKRKITLFIRRFIESGRGTNLKNNTLNKKDYDYVRERLSFELNNGNYVNGHYLRNDDGIKFRIKLPFEFTKGCKAGLRAIVVMPDGELHLCGFLAAQGFNSIGNVRMVGNWNDFWDKMQDRNCLKFLRENLERYNKIPNIQPTNCLAYVQNLLNNESVIIKGENKNEKI